MHHSTQHKPIPSVIASRYRVLREIGRGGMGAVYLVEHMHTGEHFALKLLLEHTGASPELIERFKRESRAPARIKSDHVAKVIDADVASELGGAPFLVMELLDGSNLEDHIDTSGPLSVDETLSILRQLTIALDKAHAIGIIHRDLKPENIFLHRREGHRVVKLLDFGISKLTDEGGGDINNASLTKTGAMMGTPLYMSPEQARGDAGIGPGTDIWALGLIAFRMLTKATYWDAQTIAVLMSQIIALPLVPASSRSRNLPPSFDAWFARSCDRDPSMRFRSVGEQVEALASALADPLARATLLKQTTPPSTVPLPRAIHSATTPMPPFSPSMPVRQSGFGSNTNVGIAHTKSGSASSAVASSSPVRWPFVGALGVVMSALFVIIAVVVVRPSLRRHDDDAHHHASLAASSPSSSSRDEVSPPLPTAVEMLPTVSSAPIASVSIKPVLLPPPSTPKEQPPQVPINKPLHPAAPATTYAPTAL